MPEPVHVILNPASASGRAARLARRIEDSLEARGVDYRLTATEAPGHAVELAAAARDATAPAVVAVGGDGTVHEVANGLLADGGGGSVPSLAVVPVGTGNDFFRMVGSPRDPEEALAVLQSGVRKDFDVGVARWPDGSSRFVNLLGVGVDVEVIRRREGFRRLTGLAQYLTALLVALVRFRPVPVRIRLEGEGSGAGEVIEDPTHLAAITVGPSAGGGFLLNPTATPDDGLLDLCFVDALSYLEVMRYLPLVVRGEHADLDVVRLRRFRRARLESTDGRPLEFELDGEVMPEPAPWLEVGIEPGRLPVLVPGPEGDDG